MGFHKPFGHSPWLYNFKAPAKQHANHDSEVGQSLFGNIFSGFFNFGGAEISGSRKSDVIFGSIFGDKITSKAGDDTVFGLGGADEIDAGRGDDTVSGGRGDDIINAGRGDDTVFGGRGDDYINAGRGDDMVYGGRGADVIDAGKGVNFVDGGAGDRDVLILKGKFKSYEFDFNEDGSFVVTGRGQETTAKNIEFVRDNGGVDVAVSAFEEDDVEVAFTLQLLHASDLEGGVDAISRAPNFAALVDTLEDEFENTVLISAGDNYIPGPFFNAASDFSLADPLEQSLQVLFDDAALTNIRTASGRYDIAIMNILGFDASAVGNHEFDAGPDAFETVIEDDVRDGGADLRWLGTQFPYVAANLDFSGSPDLGNLFTSEILDREEFRYEPTEARTDAFQPRLAPATIIDEGGEKIGVVGATTQVLESITSVGGVTVIRDDENSIGNDMADLAAVLQPTIDALRDQGVNKIILTSHLQQIALEEELAQLLSGVDIIIAGGSDTLLADSTDVLRSGDVAERGYPIVTNDADGDPTLIVSTDGEYSYLGRLVVDFDADGKIIVDNLDETVSGAFATTDDVVTDVTGFNSAIAARSASQKASEVGDLVEAVEGIVTGQDGNVFGETQVFIEGRREQVRTEETTLGNLTADANLAYAQVVDPTVQIALKNGGGIRAAIGEVDANSTLLPTQGNEAAGKDPGEISQLDIANALRFNNGLTLLTLTHEELAIVLEHAVAATAPGVTPGQFAQVAGVKFSYDPSGVAQQLGDDGAVLTAGSRIVNAAIVDEAGDVVTTLIENGVVQDPASEVRIVTLDFLAGGGDGYPYDAFAAANPGRVNVVNLEALTPDASNPLNDAADFAAFGSEQDALAEFLVDNFATDDDPAASSGFDIAETAPEDDRRIQDTSLVDQTEFFTNQFA